MVKTNLDKFIEIENMMNEAESHMSEYENKLKERYDYMNNLRREHGIILHNLSVVQKKLSKKINTLNFDENVKAVSKDAINKINQQIEIFQEDMYESENQKVLNLKKAKEHLQGKLHIENIKECLNLLTACNVNIEEVQALNEYADAIKDEIEDSRANILKMIERVRNEYLNSFVNYRKALEEDNDIEHKMVEIINALEKEDFSEEAGLLLEVKPEINEARSKRPETDTLLNLLNPIKSAGLEYFQSKNKNSASYDLNAKFAKEVAYARRALLENREYIGTRNAFNRLKNAFEELSNYMYERYHQLGGTPNNYHGHDDRKRN